MSDQATGVRISLLGPVTATRDGIPLDLGPRQRRILLIRLLIAQGHPVALDSLCDDLWTGNPPPAAISAVHAHISRLRRVLEPRTTGRTAHRILTSTPGGYALLIPDQARDTVRFEKSLTHTRRLLETGQTTTARTVIERALDSWHGPALADAADHPFAVREITRLRENRLLAHELHITTLLMDGAYGHAVSAAHDLVADDPLRETAWHLLMRALYLHGRPAQAVQQYNKARQVLHDELGVEPGPLLRDLHQAVQHHHTAAVHRHSPRQRPTARTH
ncbi:AfsR/SARP family transcriptional regulator [Streptomyces sp. NPDC001177]